jgi:hypothetical protein
MPITPTHPSRGRQYPGEVILLAVRWYLRYPLAYLLVAEILTERGVFIDASSTRDESGGWRKATHSAKLTSLPACSVSLPERRPNTTVL